LATVFGELGHGPIGERKASLGGARQSDLDEFAELFGLQNRRSPLWVGDLLKRFESAFVEPTDPVVCHGEVAADPIGDFDHWVAVEHFVDNSVSLVDPSRQRQVSELFMQDVPFGTG
jgi:hypothetical protein